MESSSSPQYIQLAADIVSAYVSHNAVSAADLPQLIRDIHDALVRLSDPATLPAPGVLKPAVPVEESVFDDFIVCLEDGKKLKMLKRHLMTSFNLTPDQYRQRWGLPADYPMVAPNYAARRRELAVKIGLGRKRAA